jgi:predicted RNase H-like HicB family nuclease
MPARTLTAVVQKDGNGWVSWCPELDVASQGDTAEQAKANLKEAVDLFLETASPEEIKQRLQTETYLSSLEVRIG